MHLGTVLDQGYNSEQEKKNACPHIACILVNSKKEKGYVLFSL